MSRPFVNLREALRCAAGSIAPCELSRPRVTRGSAPPDRDRGMAVRRAMLAAGCPVESPTGQSLLLWAVHDDEDVAVDRGVRATLSMALENAGLLEPPANFEFGRRVHRLGSTYWVTVVVNPARVDPNIVWGTRRGVIGRALEAGKVIEASRCPLRKPEDDLRRRAHTMISTGSSMADVDRQLARSLGVTPRTARVYRQKWGLTAKPGRPPGRRTGAP